jgi:hypothetical protein
MSAPPAIETFLRISRFSCVGLVIDLRDLATVDLLAPTLQNLDARKALAAVRGTRAVYLVLGGQLHRKKGGCFAGVLMRDDFEALAIAVSTAYRRLGELGETVSLWTLLVDEPTQKRLAVVLGEESGTEGSA